jgi:hypothetical protein
MYHCEKQFQDHLNSLFKQRTAKKDMAESALVFTDFHFCFLEGIQAGEQLLLEAIVWI